MQLIKDIRDGKITPEEAVDKFDLPGQHIADIEVDLQVEPLTCGFRSFEENYFFRKHRPDLITIASRPGGGKTSIGMQMALNVSEMGPVLLFSLEMSKDQLKQRILSLETGKSALQLKVPSNLGLIKAANQRLRNLKLYIDDQNSLDIDTLVSRAINYNRRSPLSLIVVDYMQIVNTAISRSRTEEISYISEKLKNLAKEIRCPVLALAQMSRNIDQRLREDENARPMMSDLAESSGIEKWSDVILAIHKPNEHIAKVFCLKNRHGAMKDVSMQFSGELTKFIEFDNVI